MNQEDPHPVTHVEITESTEIFNPYHTGSGRSSSYANRRFIAWDGEACIGENGYHPYSLFGWGNEPHEHIIGYDLSTMACLQHMMTAPAAIHISFSFGYDVNMILKDLPHAALEMLRETGWTRYRGFNIHHIPRKWFQVTYEKVTVKIFDLFSFFNGSFEKAINDYEIGTTDERTRVASGKADRSVFEYIHMDSQIRPYWSTELRLMVDLANRLRDIIYGAGFKIKSWHGPGALASYQLTKHKAVEYKSGLNTPKEVLEVSRYAYFGGHFEPFKAGFYDGSVYAADINSAYAYTISRLPSLANGTWNHVLGGRDIVADTRCGFFHLRFALANPTPNFPMPLPHRSKNGMVSFPPITEGWYHSAEAYNLRNESCVEFVEAWIYDDDGSMPFAWVNDMFHERLLLQQAGNPAEKALKWSLASLYGATARRVGYDKKTGKPPKFHDLTWAGMTTGECRALIYHASLGSARTGDLVSIDTDGILATVPFDPNTLPNGEGNALGQWKLTEYTGLLYFQSGIYWLRDHNGEWLPPKSRGIPRKKLPFDLAYEALQDNKPISINQHSFIGYGLAAQRNWKDWRKWVDDERDYVFGGNGKRFHNPDMCEPCGKGVGLATGLHTLATLPPREVVSYPHSLPWLDPDHDDTWRDQLRWGIHE